MDKVFVEHLNKPGMNRCFLGILEANKCKACPAVHNLSVFKGNENQFMVV